MRLALLVALSRDRRSGARVLSGVVPADQAIKTIKDLIAKNECPDPRYPIVQALTLDSVIREHVFKPTAEQINAVLPEGEIPPGQELDALLAANEQMHYTIEELTEAGEESAAANARAVAALGEAQEAAEQSRARIAELEAALADKKKK